MSYAIQCHCGAVKGEVDTDLPAEAVTCNCSHCSAKGLVLAAIKRDQLTITSGAEALRTYRFNRHVIDHHFCAECGTQPFSEAAQDDGKRMAMVNLRCAPAADLDAIRKIEFDGASV